MNNFNSDLSGSSDRSELNKIKKRKPYKRVCAFSICCFYYNSAHKYKLPTNRFVKFVLFVGD